MKKDEDFSKLTWMRVFTPIHIPRYLVEQVTHRDYSVDDFYKYQEQACIKQTEQGAALNPLNHLYVLSDEENLVKGFLWFVIDPLTKDICIQTYSIDKEYWCRGKAVKKLATFIKGIQKKANLNKIYWVTNYPKHSKWYGFKPSEAVLMEYDPKQEEEKSKERAEKEKD